MNGQSLTHLKRISQLGLGLLALLAAMLILQPENNRVSAQDSANIRLQSAQGEVTLKDYQGKVAVLFFGFGSCPDVCPTTLAVLSQGIKALPEQQRDQVVGLFVSVDPKRDTPAKLQEYAGYFSSHIQGLTGERDQLDALVQYFGGFYRLVELPDSALGYTVDHSAALYFIDRSGRRVQTLNHGSSPQQISSILSQLLASPSS